MTAKSNNQKRTEKDILWFEEISIKDVPLVGGKNASLGEMYSKLTPKGVSVPNGFALTSTAYWKFLKNTGLEKEIKKAIKGLDVSYLIFSSRRRNTRLVSDWSSDVCSSDLRALVFFSSRRRHTRLVSDWSSDVCSSD